MNEANTDIYILCNHIINMQNFILEQNTQKTPMLEKSVANTCFMIKEFYDRKNLQVDSFKDGVLYTKNVSLWHHQK